MRRCHRLIIISAMAKKYKYSPFYPPAHFFPSQPLPPPSLLPHLHPDVLVGAMISLQYRKPSPTAVRK